MKSRPILFNAAMVKAILDGRKTQTRRPVKNQPSNGWAFEDAEKGGAFFRITSSHPKKGKWGAMIRRGVGTDFPEADIEVSPYGMPGDRLWVRETWQGPLVNQEDEGAIIANKERFQNPKYCSYEASGDSCEFYDIELEELVYRWKPSIHMPRWACRLVLEITNVRLEQVQDISEEDAKKEGTITEQMAADAGLSWRFGDRRQFKDMWDKVYPNSWKNNEWVWVIEFKIVELKTA
ncbi:hypothetical protein C0J08_15145 [Marinomonas sp. CT5]|uniref:hypothetical protein n=1 Tax=Marinomonas sp. CT5 TaxID=2066133 RepID=UPI001BAFE213|nr:hypothetical protein [Marinomonas sp. CT5]QUX96652.1 hypothetical protein C0J08_15145 [Marinomonas sp. CT5]